MKRRNDGGKTVVGPEALQKKRKEREIAGKINVLDRLEEALVRGAERRAQEDALKITAKDRREYEEFVRQCREADSGDFIGKMLAGMVSDGRIDIELFTLVKNRGRCQDERARSSNLTFIEELLELVKSIEGADDGLAVLASETRESITSGKKGKPGPEERLLMDIQFDEEERRIAVIMASDALLTNAVFHSVLKATISGGPVADEDLSDVAAAIKSIDLGGSLLAPEVLEVAPIRVTEVLESALFTIKVDLENWGVSTHEVDDGKVEIVYTLADAGSIERECERLERENRLAGRN